MTSLVGMNPPDLSSQVHVVDDDESLRTALARLLRAAGFEVSLYASAGEFALAGPGPRRGCLLLDVRMPGPSGLELQEALQRQGGGLPVIFLTGHGDIPMSVKAIKAGAVDFLTKPVQRETLLAAVRSALVKEAEGRSSQAQQREVTRRLRSLTAREMQVLERVIAGQPNKQIALELGAAERTVKAHRAVVMSKMGVASLAELVQVTGDFRRRASSGQIEGSA